MWAIENGGINLQKNPMLTVKLIFNRKSIDIGLQ